MIVAWYIKVVIGQIVHYKEVDFFLHDDIDENDMIKVERSKGAGIRYCFN